MSYDNSDSAARKALVIGAGSAIARAVIAQLLQHPTARHIIAVSRDAGHQSELQHPGITPVNCDYSPSAINQVARDLSVFSGTVDRVFVCSGILHSDTIRPEKRLEDLDATQMAEVFHINSILPALWLQALLPLLKTSPHCIVTVLSARVGSIGDNRTGGWYSYRASKAALNMLIKTAAVEYSRRAPGVKLLAYHPGTVDTGLSQPFQKNVDPHKLFTPQFAATKLLSVTDSLLPDGQASYLDWAGNPIEW